MKHFSLSDRKILSDLIKEKISYREMSKILGKSLSSISDEIKRNSSLRDYDPHKTHEKACRRKKERKKRRKLEISPGLKNVVIEKLLEDLSPEQIFGELKELAEGKTVISHETIYQFIYSEEGRKLKLWQHLRHKKEHQRRHWGTRKHRPVIPNRVSIHKRPVVINERKRFGDFEGDLMLFSNSPKALAVFVERTARKTFVIVNENKTAAEMEMALHELLCSAGIVNVRSIAFDNGLENVCHEKVREDYEFHFDTYFCDSYCSWQKGLVENTNKLLRQYFPRNIDPQLLTQDYADQIAKKLNNRPRKCLQYSTPNKLFSDCSV